jgi:hypothetical protein
MIWVTFPDYHQTIKKVLKLNDHFIPEELEAALKKFVNRYINKRYHKLLNNLTPAAIYIGR